MQTFTETCSESYDRHVYELVLKDGRSFTYDDYESLRAAWYHNNGMKQLSHVNVLDRPAPKKAPQKNRTRKLGFV